MGELKQASQFDTGLSENFKKNLEGIKTRVDPEKENQDWPIVLEGGEGSGKSALAQAIALEIEGDDFNPEKQVAFSGEEFKEKAKDLESGRVIIYDEGVDDLMATDTMTAEGRSIVKFFRRCRELNLIVIVCFPVFMEMNKKIRKNRIQTLGSCQTKTKGGRIVARWCNFYSKKQIDESDLSSDKDAQDVDYPRCYLTESWNDPEDKWPEIWSKYKDLKEGDIRDNTDEEDEVDLPTIARSVKNKIEDYKSEYKGREYVDKDLIQMDFDLSQRKSKKVKKLVERDLGLGSWGDS